MVIKCASRVFRIILRIGGWKKIFVKQIYEFLRLIVDTADRWAESDMYNDNKLQTFVQVFMAL